MFASRVSAPPSIFGRYTFRPLGGLAIIGTALALLLLAGVSAQFLHAKPVDPFVDRPPTLNLSVRGDFQQAVHFQYVQDSAYIGENISLVAPLYVLPVSPNEWLRFYTNSPLGLPRSAQARIYRSQQPEPCYGQVLIGCIEVDVASPGESIPLYPEVSAGLGFPAPSTPGSYWIALDANWGSGGRTQVFVIDVRG